jgi:hypothetical protein
MFAALALFAAGCTSSSPSKRGDTAETPARESAEALVVVAARTPRLPVRRYDTSGTFPQVRDGELDLRAVNAALQASIRADQREFTPEARRSVARSVESVRGIYSTAIDRKLISASTIVVSALLPATKLYPAGTEGKTWVAMTVEVPSGRMVGLEDLFAEPSSGIRALAAAWLKRAQRHWAPCIRLVPERFRPSADNYRYFALTPRGVAVGFWQPPACNRVHATVPYEVLRAHLSELGQRLVDGVRAPRSGP